MTPLLRHIYIVSTGASVIVGLFLALVFFRQHHKNKKISFVLSTLMVAFAISVALNSYLHIFIQRAYPGLWSFPEPFLLLIGPLFYTYIRSLSGAFSYSKKTLIHFLPFLLVALGLIVFANHDAESMVDYRDLWHVIGLMWLAITLHFWTYYFLNHRALLKFREKLKQTRSSIENIYQSWISYCLMTLLICYTVLSILFLLGHGQIFIPINKSLAVVLSLIIFGIGYRTLTHPEIFVDVSTDIGTSNQDRDEKYRKSGLSKPEIGKELKKIEKFVKTEKPYLDSNLDLKTLADMLDLSSHHLSQVINTGTNLNFYDFINNYRVAEAKELLSDPRNDHLTVLSIAFDAGFNSKATFNRFFKKATNQTPSQFRKSQQS